MDRSQCRFAMVLTLAIAASGCRLSQKPEGDPLVGDVMVLESEGELEKIEKIPVSLWSPTQRQSSASYYFLAGEMLSLRGESVRALPVLEAAYGMDPNPFIAARLISTKAITGNRAEAESDAHKMVLLYPKDSRLRFLYGEMLMAGQRWSDAAEQFQRSVELDPDSESGYLLLSAAYQADKRVSQAIEALNHLVKRMPGSVPGWSALARLHIAAGKKRAALAPAQRAYELRSADPENALVLAIAYELNNRSKDAMPLYEQLYRMNPTNDELITRMVAIYSQLGNLQDALQLLEDTEKASKESKPGIQMQRAIILWELKRDKEAAELLDKLILAYPDSDRLRYMAAIGKERTGKLETAIELYGSIPANSPFKSNAEFRRALNLKELKRLAEAEELVMALLDAVDAGPELSILAASIFSDSEKYDSAIDVLEKGYLAHPEVHRLLFVKGVYQEKAGKIRDCMNTMRQVIKVDPQNSSAFNFLGYMYAERGENLEEAEKLVRRALELKPDDGYYLDSLGWIQYQMGKVDEALVTLNAALKQTPDEGVVWEHVAEVNEKKGRIEEAKKAFEKALSSKLEARDKKRIEEKAAAFRAKHGTPPK